MPRSQKGKARLITILTMLLLATVLFTACGGATNQTAFPPSSENPSNGGESSGSEGNGSEGGKNGSILITEAFHSLLYLPVYVAKEKGIFEKNGVNVLGIRAAGSGPTALASVLSGEAKFSVHGPEHVAFANTKGGNGRAVSLVANSAPVWILAREDVEVQSPADLRGKRIVVALAPGTSNTMLKRLLAENDIDIQTEVTVTEVQNGSELGPVLAGQADIAVAYQPQVEQGIAQGLKIVYDFTKEFPDFAFSTINTSQKVIENEPELVEKFVRSIEESLDYIHRNPDEAKAVARKEFPNLDGETVDAAVQRMIDSNVYPQKANINETAFQNAMEIQKFVGNIQKDVNYDDIIDPSFTK
ncbi:ABC transporter substrate-binding protein [Bacillaceae bacterium]